MKNQNLTSPVSRRIGLGAWQFLCSIEEFEMNPVIPDQKGVVDLAPW